MKLLSWNVNGVRAVQKKGFQGWFCDHGADVVCLQETKAHKEQLDEAVTNLRGYESYWCSGEKKGYSGVATYTRQKRLATKFGFGVPEFDREGRVLITTFPEFELYNIYFPKASEARSAWSTSWVSTRPFSVIGKGSENRASPWLSAVTTTPRTTRSIWHDRKTMRTFPDS